MVVHGHPSDRRDKPNALKPEVSLPPLGILQR